MVRLGLVFGLLVVSAQNQRKKIKLVRLVCNWISGPIGGGGPRSVFRVSCRGPKIFVIILGNFRRLEKYINSIRYLDETYNYNYKRFIFIVRNNNRLSRSCVSIVPR